MSSSLARRKRQPQNPYHNLHLQLSVFNSLTYPITRSSRLLWQSDALQRLRFLSQTELMLLRRDSQPQRQPQAQQPHPGVCAEVPYLDQGSLIA